MKKKGLIIVIGIAVLGVAWYAFRPERLFVDEVVSESFPAAQGTMASNEPAVLFRGTFHDVLHTGKGVATIYDISGRKVLRFTEFETSNGPDVKVYLVAANDAQDNATVTGAGFVSLGSIKGNKGDQNYELPANIDLGRYRAVTVWCERFSENFATAALEPVAKEPVVLSRGHFHGVSHEGKGVATIYELAGGKKLLRFTEFEVSNGPDVQVYLVAAPDANDDGTVTTAGFISLGPIKGNKGDQNYEIPDDLDCTKYRSVTIWCKRFGKNFSTAPLTEQDGKVASM
jgi:Electron transfer DM13